MSSLVEAAGGPEKVVEIGGEAYTFSPITVEDLKEFDVAGMARWREQCKADAIALGQALEASGAGTAMDRLQSIETAMRQPYSRGAMQSTMWGLQFVLWRSLLHAHPEVTFDQVGQMVPVDGPIADAVLAAIGLDGGGEGKRPLESAEAMQS